MQRDTSFDDDGYFAYGIALYAPSVSAAVRDAAREMDAMDVTGPDGTRKQDDAPQEASTNTATEENKKLYMKEGPSGIVEQDI